MTGFEPDDRLAVDPEVDPEHAVRARVLRAHADDELVGVEFADLDAAGQQRLALGVVAAGELGPILEVLGDLHVGAVGIDLLGPEVLAEALLDAAVEDLGRPLVVRLEEVLAEREVRVAFPHEDALQLGVAGEPDAHHVVDFAFLEIGPAPDVIERGNLALPLGLGGAHPQLDQLAGIASCCRAGS